MKQHHVLHGLQRRIRERLAKHTSLAPMQRLIDSIVRIVDAFDCGKAVVEVCFLNPLSMAVDIVQAPVTIYRDEVRCHAHMASVFCVQCM